MFRLLLALLIALLPMPAAMACHAEQPPAASAGHAHHQPAEREQPSTQPAADQLCMGCVAPAAVPAPQLAPPAVFARVAVLPGIAGGETRATPPPATPPPRSDA